MLLGLSIAPRGTGLCPLRLEGVDGLRGRDGGIYLGRELTVGEVESECLVREERGYGGLHIISVSHYKKLSYNKLFPNFNVRSSGGLWSPLPGLPLFPRRSSAGERAGLDGVNHKSENGSCRTCASEREGSNACRVRAGSCCQRVFRTKLLPLRRDVGVFGVRSFRIEPRVRVIYRYVDA